MPPKILEIIEQVSTTPSDRGRFLFPLRVPYKGDKVQFKIIDMVLKEKRFWHDVDKTRKKCPQHPVIERVRFSPFGFHMKEIRSNSK